MVPANMPVNSSMAGWLPAIVARSCRNSSGGSCPEANCNVLRHRPGIAAVLVVGHRLRPWTGPGERVVERCRAQFGAEERIGHPVGGNRILQVARITNQRPARPVGLTEVVGRAAADHPLFTSCVCEAIAVDLADGPHVVLLEIGLHRAGLDARPRGQHHGEPIVGRECAEPMPPGGLPDATRRIGARVGWRCAAVVCRGGARGVVQSR